MFRDLRVQRIEQNYVLVFVATLYEFRVELFAKTSLIF